MKTFTQIINYGKSQIFRQVFICLPNYWVTFYSFCQLNGRTHKTEVLKNQFDSLTAYIDELNQMG